MPYVNKPRPYKRGNELYKSKPEQIEMRVKRNKARRDACLLFGLKHGSYWILKINTPKVALPLLGRWRIRFLACPAR